MKALKKPLARRGLIIAVCGIIILSFILLSVFVDKLEEKGAWRQDYSFNSATTQSEQTTRVLRSLPYKVRAYALSTPGMEDQMLLGLLNRLSSLSPNFSYTRDSLVNNPMLVNTISSSLQDEQVTADSLILVCEATGRTRVLNTYNYLAQSYDTSEQNFVLSGLAYEKSIVEALVYLTMDTVPGVRLLSGHGEIGETDTDYMETFLKSHHFELSRVNLLSGDKLDKDDLLVILSPQKDLTEGELTALMDFSKAGGAMLITSDYNDPDSLPRFDSLYRLMGFERKSGIVVAEGADLNAYIDNPLYLTPYMDMTEPTAPLIGAGQVRLRLPGARAFNMLSLSDTAAVEPLLTSGMAYIKPVEQANQTLAYEEGEETGQFYVALLSDYAHPDGTHARAMIIGNSAILLDSWLHEVTYGSQFLLHMVNYLSPKKPVNLDIAPRRLVREQLSVPSPAVPALLIILLPVLTALAALPVLYKRSRR